MLFQERYQLFQKNKLGLALGEVQVSNKIDLEYIEGLILPFSQEQLQHEEIKLFVDKIYEICEKNNLPLNIYNYEGELIKQKSSKKSK